MLNKNVERNFSKNENEAKITKEGALETQNGVRCRF